MGQLDPRKLVFIDETWINILRALVDKEVQMHSTSIDSSYVKAHRSSHGGKGGRKIRLSAPRVAVKPRKYTH